VEPTIDHVQITVRDLDAVRARIEEHDFEVVEYMHPLLDFAITSPRSALREETVHRRRPGALHHLAFRAGSREEVDRLHRDLLAIGAEIVGGPRLWPEHGPDYYAVFFKDPEGIKYEIVHCPRPE
jgi:catechol 2,3-dioxygenase-like lactoylglutathione lyase family enzyme